MTHYYKYEGMREEDRNALIPAILNRNIEPEPEDEYQIYCDRGNGLELDGCWGSEHAQFATIEDANNAAEHLAKNYPDCAWVVCDSDQYEVSRIPAEGDEPCYFINGDRGNPFPHDWTDAGEGFSRCRHCGKVVE